MQTNFYPMYYMQFPQNARVQPSYRPMMPMKANAAQQFYQYNPQQFQAIPKRDLNQEKINRINRLNRMKANTKQTKWTPEEEELLEQKFEELGPHWSRMKYYFPGRTDVNLKNHWSSMMNRKKKEEVMKKISQNEPSELESPSNEENFENTNAEEQTQSLQINYNIPNEVSNSIQSSENSNENEDDQTDNDHKNDFNRNTSYDNLFNNLYEDVDVDCCIPTFNAVDF